MRKRELRSQRLSVLFVFMLRSSVSNGRIETSRYQHFDERATNLVKVDRYNSQKNQLKNSKVHKSFANSASLSVVDRIILIGCIKPTTVASNELVKASLDEGADG
ncbi:putative YbfN [Trichinella spiralis]|uniref:putative YbfN n=1 Tax=Trichinella spiralis TaxID=6334 RepID=UPI0001EFE3E8|nr:putative YbfN [Trichinella spiralis]